MPLGVCQILMEPALTDAPLVHLQRQHPRPVVVGELGLTHDQGVAGQSVVGVVVLVSLGGDSSEDDAGGASVGAGES